MKNQQFNLTMITVLTVIIIISFLSSCNDIDISQKHYAKVIYINSIDRYKEHVHAFNPSDRTNERLTIDFIDSVGKWNIGDSVKFTK